jgi:hypothetical protein
VDYAFNRFTPAATLYLCLGFALYERKTETQKKEQYRSAEGWSLTA